MALGVICLSRWTVGLFWWLAPLQFGLMLALAAASYHTLEAPLRRAHWSRSQLRSFFYGLSSVSGVAMAIIFLLGPGDKHLFSGTEQMAAAAATPNPGGSTPPKGTLLLVGDSHAGHFAKLAKNVSAKLGLRGVLISNGATPFPAIPISSPVGGLTLEKTRSTRAMMERDVQQALAGLDHREINIIILSSFYRFYFEPLLGERKYMVTTHYDAAGHPISVQQSLDNWLRDLKVFAAQNRGTRIIIILSTPEMPDIYPLALCQKEWFRAYLSEKCFIQVDRQKTVSVLTRLNSRIIQAVASSPNVSIFDPLPAICPKEQVVCSSQNGDERLFADEDHLTAFGARQVEAMFLESLVKSGLLRYTMAPNS